mmetsp:Transcript_20647/g.24806  ORF Transcript_20647/g.24806 Transcript_20647/m.24806 type:complete len:326 (-) Transcript_20647:684-1661(-)|eukprot:CAMPEP_0197864220 /NCGR_PEP_ID=MMETSP1438-20131217/42304_1 /TAXON_ID=1461541 /ORGANISM="Pterosperma sp., Strain CCMP1384" /LENGTH=325 /DNA_ID=CAMNT_0043482385 /DNA_START=93 /DNA_END=1070 /DNA_ORIENTATION=+
MFVRSSMRCSLLAIATQASSRSASALVELPVSQALPAAAASLVHSVRTLTQSSVHQKASNTEPKQYSINPNRHSLSEAESRILGSRTDFEASPLKGSALKPPSSLPRTNSTTVTEASSSKGSAKYDLSKIFEDREIKDVPTHHPDGTENTAGSCVRAPGRLSVQESYEPDGCGFGGGPANKQGLQLKSYRTADGQGLESEWVAAEHYQAFPGVMAGGVVGAALECQGNWTAAIALKDAIGLRFPPLTVTAGYTVDLISPSPIDEAVKINSRVLEIVDNHKVTVEMEMSKQDNLGNWEVSAKGTGVFVKIGAMRDIRVDFDDEKDV